MLSLWPILLGWPAILVSIALSVAGIVRNRPAWLVVAAIIVVPISLYLFGTPRISWIALAFPVLLFGASMAIRRSLPWLAWLLLVPFVGFFGWLAVIVYSE
jgi:hypothetical protein